MTNIIKCMDCKYGQFIISCKADKAKSLEELKYKCEKIRGTHDSQFYCGYANKKKIGVEE